MTGASHLPLPSTPRRVALALGFAALLSACTAQPEYPIGGEAPGPGLQPLVPAYPVRAAPGATDAAPAPQASAPASVTPAFPPAGDDDAAAATTPYPRSAAGAVDQSPLPPASESAPPAAPKASYRAPIAESPPAPVPTHHLVRRPGTLNYVVAQSDTLWGVGRRFGLDSSTLARANGLDPDRTLHPGTRLKLPADAHDAGERSHASGVAERTPGRTVEVVDPLPRHRPRALATASPPSYVPAPPPLSPPSLSPPPASISVPTPVDHAEAGPAAPIPYSQLVSGRSARARRRRNEAVASASDTPTRLADAAPPAALPVEAPAPDAQAVAEAARGRFIRPVAGALVSGFGSKGPGQRNDGVDLAARAGESVRAAAAGVIVYAGHDVPALGNLVAVKHADGWVTVYGNLETITVRPAEHVGQGDQIGLAGPTSATPRAQVHFEVRYAANPSDKARPVDPTLVLPKAG